MPVSAPEARAVRTISSCSYAVEPEALKWQAKIAAAEEALIPYTEALNAAKAAIKPYDDQIKAYQAEITTRNNNIKKEKAIKPTKDEPDLAPDQSKIDAWEQEIAEYNLLIREQRGYSYELRKELNAAQAAYDEYNAALKKANEDYKNRKFSEDPETMRIYEEELERAANPEAFEELPEEEAKDRKERISKMNGLSTTYDARKNNYDNKLKEVEELEKSLETYFVPDQAQIDEDYAKISAEADELTALVETLEAEERSLRDPEAEAKKAVAAAEEALKAAEEVLNEKKEPFAPFNKDNAIALSYVEDKETEIAGVQKKLDDENAKATPSETKIADYEKQLETLNAELETLKATYAETVAKGAAEKQAYDEALADYNAKAEALKAAQNAEAITALAAKSAELSDAKTAKAKAIKARDDMLREEYEYYDVMAKALYTAFFKSLITECEADPDYTIFMNLGEEAENDKGIVSIYNNWYDSMYGAG